MPRRPGMWERAGRGWYTTIGGKQVPLGADRREAEKAFARLVLGRGGAVPRVTVAELTQLWLDGLKSTRRELTWKSARQFARVWCKKFGRTRASELRPLHVTAWLEAEKTWGKSTRAIATRAIKSCFAWGLDQGYLETHPIQRLRAPQTQRRAPISEEHLATWTAAIRCPELRAWVEVSLATGCRPGELAGADAASVAQDGRSVAVSGKTGKRTVPLGIATSKLLGTLKRKHPSGPLLRSPMGRAWNRFSLAWHFREVSKRAGVDVVPYHLRGVFATRSLRVNGEILTAKLLGHKSLTSLHGHYEGLDIDDLRAAVEKVKGRKAR